MTIQNQQIEEWRSVNRAVGAANRSRPRPFAKWKLFNAYMGTYKPVELMSLGIPTVHLMTGDLLWPTGTELHSQIEPDESWVRNLVKGDPYWSTIGFPGGGWRTIEHGDIIVLDAECWLEDSRFGASEIDLAQTAERYLCLIRAMQREAALVRKHIYIGAFGYAGSTRYYNGPMFPAYAGTWEPWLKDSALLSPIVAALDFLCPELYFFCSKGGGSAPASESSQRAGYPTLADEWIGASFNRLAFCSRWGRPVIPFICPQYIPGGKSNPSLDWTEIEPAFWSQMLALVRENADGAVLWGGWKSDGFQVWNPGQWWPVTQAFLK